MLQSSKTQSETSREPAGPEVVSGAEVLQSFVSFVRCQFSIIIFSVLLMTVLGIIYVTTARPSFTAEAQLLIDPHSVHLFQQQSLINEAPIDVAQVESQVQVLKSENIAAAVIKNLHLTEDREFVGSESGLLGTLIGFVFSPFGSDHAPSEFTLSRQAMDAFKSRLDITRVGLSYVINIGFRSYDPENAAKIANEVADAYIADQLEAKYQATRRAGAWLQDRIK